MKKNAVLILGLLLSVSLTAQTTWKKASSEKYSVTFEYPTNWSAEETQDGLVSEGLLLGDDNNKAAFSYMLYDMPENFNLALFDTAAKQMLSYMTTNGGFKQNSELKETTISGHKAFTCNASMDFDGSTMDMVLIIVFHKNELGMLMYGDDKKQLSQTYEKYFKHMLSTIVLTD